MLQTNFTIKSWDFSRNDGLVNVTIVLHEQLNGSGQQQIIKGGGPIQQQQNGQNQIQEIAAQNLVTEKIRIQKLQIQQLKTLLKRPNDPKEFWEFYLLCCEKLIEIDFGKIELFNIQGDNQYSIDELSEHREQQTFIRWGKIFSLEHLSLEENNQAFQFVKLQYYNQLVRERIFTLRCLSYYKNDHFRKAFPYSYLYVLDLEDTFHFNQFKLREIFSQIVPENHNEDLLLYASLKLKKDFHQTFFNRYSLSNVIIPSLIYLNSDCQEPTYYFIHVNQKQNNKKYQVKVYIEGIQEEKKQRIQEQVQELLQKIEIELKIEDITFSNFEQRDFLKSYVHFIEKTFFKSRQSIENLMQLYFNQLPQHLSENSINTPLMKNIVLPDNIQEILQTQGLV